MKDKDTVWQEMRDMLEVEINSLGFDIWIAPLRPVEIDGDVLVLNSPSAKSKTEVAAK